MTDRIIAYRNSQEEWDDSLLGPLVDWVAGHVWKATKVGVAISILPFTLGALFTPAGTDRLQGGLEATGMTHEFLWTHAINAGTAVVDTVVPPLADFMDNGSGQLN